jgi:metal-responsive CopG/Arc/MetJ family transcriptional regulator
MVEKIAVSLDSRLLARAERLRRATGESRSALVARALRDLVRSEAQERRVREYVEAYRRMPETTHEVRTARALARRSVTNLPWEGV